jgi:hypothetical protein
VASSQLNSPKQLKQRVKPTGFDNATVTVAKINNQAEAADQHIVNQPLPLTPKQQLVIDRQL